MICRFVQTRALEDGRTEAVCSNCGRRIAVAGAAFPRAQCRAAARLGPGGHLHRLLADYGVKPRVNCQCEARAAEMDAWGADECERRREEIAAWLVQSADQIPVAKWLPQWSKRRAALWLIDEAIRRSREIVPLRWALGVVTAPRATPTLGRTLASLRHAGWDSPLVVFSEPGVARIDGIDGCEWRVNERRLGGWPNWLQAFRALLAEQPHADYYAMFQDDVVLCRRARQAVEVTAFPADTGFVSPYTPSVYARGRGWRAVDPGPRAGLPGYGLITAQTLIFPAAAARRLVDDEWLADYERVHPRGDGANNYDAAIGHWAARSHLRMFFHVPSLAQHIGAASTIWPGARLAGKRAASDFVGEAADALHLPPPQPKPKPVRRRAAKRARQPLEYISYERLAADARELASRLPADAIGVVAVPRSGMLPASIIATLLHLPLYTLRDGRVAPAGHGERLKEAPRQDGPLVVVDDSVYAGHALKKARQALQADGRPAIYAALYPRPEAVDLVDLYARPVAAPHLYEWNLMNCHQARSYALDFDGVLCHDLPRGADADADGYAAAIRDARPYLLRRKASVPLVVTARPETMRVATQEWLARWRVTVERLVMWPGAPRDRTPEAVARWKAEHYAASGLSLFVESDPAIAERMARLSGKPVLCPAAEKVYQNS